MIQVLKGFIGDQLFRPYGAESGPITLTQRRIFILPTRYGFGFLAMLAVMLMGSVNYALSLGFVLTFLLGSMALVSILHAFRNLAELRVSIARAEPVFAGETAHFPLHLQNPSRQGRFAVGVARQSQEQEYTDVPVAGEAVLALQVPAPRRGVLPAGRFTLFTRYPIGLFYAWSPIELPAACIVYPRPDESPLPSPAPLTQAGAAASAAAGDEDFAGLKPYHPGDSPSRIAWKAVARGRVFLTKQFAGPATEDLWLDWNDISPSLDTEARLSRLAGWVVQADRLHLHYGLRLPGQIFLPGTGELQRQRCLEALARFDAKQPGDDAQ